MHPKPPTFNLGFDSTIIPTYLKARRCSNTENLRASSELNAHDPEPNSSTDLYRCSETSTFDR